MARLSVDVITFIVTRLACFERPMEVQKAVTDTFKVTVPLPHIMYYDPTTSGTGVGRKWRKLFEKTRDEFTRETAHIPIAHKSVRLSRLQRLLDKAEEMRNIPVAGQLIEQAAKEVGGAYTNRHVLESADPAADLARVLGMNREDVLAALGAAE
jgi:hypothetical protein